MARIYIFTFKSKEAAKGKEAELRKKGYRPYSRLHKIKGEWNFAVTK